MKLTVSKPVQLVLASALVTAAVTLLRPDSIELPMLTERPDSGAIAARTPTPEQTAQSDAPWLRPQLPEPIATQAPMSQSGSSGPIGLPPLPPAGTLARSDNPPPLPSGSVASQPSAPDIVYLGRMIRDGKTQVFFASGGSDPVVLKAGDVLDDSWTIQSISSTNVTLKHLHSGETRVIAMGGGTGSAQPGGGASQVGQGFLASSPADVHIQPVN
ncbi:hypothetical protein [Burkholderia sp. BCC0397]|uniref:hypothetical protein n=1 Tax=Burkholderia sp. BCC0397 TaxID=486876 RepID=UPI00158D3E4E|nr:hypothetical protein [Burkholderia sp. BCC0397]